MKPLVALLRIFSKFFHIMRMTT